VSSSDLQRQGIVTPGDARRAFGARLALTGTMHWAADAVAAEIAAKDSLVIRLAKQSLNGIDPVDVKRSYRYEQGFTYELHVAGVADEQRAAFVEKRDADTTR